jgi:hypothetical protein
MAGFMNRLLVFVMIILIGKGSVLSAQSLDCGKPPELPYKSQETEKLRGELEGKAQLLSRLIGNADLKGAVETERNTLFQSADQVLAAWQANYLSYVFCASVMSDKSLSVEKRIDAWRQFQQAMQAPKAELTPHDVENIKLLLEDIKSNAPKLLELLATKDLSDKYPLAYALLYSDTHKTLYYNVPNDSGVSVDLENIKTIDVSLNRLCVSGFTLIVRTARLQISNSACFSMRPGTIWHLTALGGNPTVAVDIEALGQSNEGVAWVIGFKPYTPRSSL